MEKRKIFLWSLTVAAAGFLFGFDTVVISGAEKALAAKWPLDQYFYGVSNPSTAELLHGLIILSSALWGTVIGAMFGGIPTEKWGRKPTLIVIGILYFISAVGSGLATGPMMFAIYRFIGGLGVGASTIAAPAYISEISPAADRGRLVALYQFNIVFGILIAFLSNYVLRDVGAEPWRWMVGSEAFPALVYMILIFFVPESPRWLIIHKNDEVAAAPSLKIVNPAIPVDEQIAAIKADHQKSQETTIKETIWNSKYRTSMMLAFFISFFNQFSGINAFLYLSNRIFELAGLEKSSALLSSAGVGLVNLIFTYVGLMLIDRLGRRQLMFIGSVGYIISLSLVAMAFHFEWQGMAVPIFLFLFIASHAVGQGAIIWVFISEIFPNHLRAAGSAFGTSVHWMLAAAIPAFTPWMMAKIGPAAVFAFFACMMVGQLIWTWRFMPETKGVSLEDMQARLNKVVS